MRYIYNAEKDNFSNKTIFRRLFISTVLNNIGTRSEFRFLLYRCIQTNREKRPIQKKKDESWTRKVKILRLILFIYF